jgi:hypothetical protein
MPYSAGKNSIEHFTSFGVGKVYWQNAETQTFFRSLPPLTIFFLIRIFSFAHSCLVNSSVLAVQLSSYRFMFKTERANELQ